ncbi:hypothetical protein BC828DRAFT_380188 [Blastocladiella britannica]|nr:hypothetical protein BC828DRAFT_380188 [Blastocladiella britannica]
MPKIVTRAHSSPSLFNVLGRAPAATTSTCPVPGVAASVLEASESSDQHGCGSPLKSTRRISRSDHLIKGKISWGRSGRGSRTAPASAPVPPSSSPTGFLSPASTLHHQQQQHQQEQQQQQHQQHQRPRSPSPTSANPVHAPSRSHTPGSGHARRRSGQHPRGHFLGEEAMGPPAVLISAPSPLDVPLPQSPTYGPSDPHESRWHSPGADGGSGRSGGESGDPSPQHSHHHHQQQQQHQQHQQHHHHSNSNASNNFNISGDNSHVNSRHTSRSPSLDLRMRSVLKHPPAPSVSPPPPLFHHELSTDTLDDLDSAASQPAAHMPPPPLHPHPRFPLFAPQPHRLPHLVMPVFVSPTKHANKRFSLGVSPSTTPAPAPLITSLSLPREPSPQVGQVPGDAMEHFGRAIPTTSVSTQAAAAATATETATAKATVAPTQIYSAPPLAHAFPGPPRTPLARVESMKTGRINSFPAPQHASTMGHSAPFGRASEKSLHVTKSTSLDGGDSTRLLNGHAFPLPPRASDAFFREQAQCGDNKSLGRRSARYNALAVVSSEHGSSQSLNLPMDLYLVKRYFIIRLVEALSIFGAPSYRIEHVLYATAESLKLPATFHTLPNMAIISLESPPSACASCHSNPTSPHQALTPPSTETLALPLRQGYDYGRLYVISDLTERLARRQVTLEEAIDHIDFVISVEQPSRKGLLASPGSEEAMAEAGVVGSSPHWIEEIDPDPTYHRDRWWWCEPAFARVCSSVSCALIAPASFGGSWGDFVAAGLLGTTVQLVSLASGRFSALRLIEDPLCAFLCGFLGLFFYVWAPRFAAAVGILNHDPGFTLCYRCITISGLLMPLPGLMLCTGMVDLTTGHLISGTTRLFKGIITAVLLAMGIMTGYNFYIFLSGVKLQGPIFVSCDPTRSVMHSSSAGYAAVAILVCVMVLSNCALLRAAPRQIPIMSLTGLIAYWLSHLLDSLNVSADASSIIVSFAVGAVSNAYSRLTGSPAIAPLTAGIFLLVPGGMATRSTMALIDPENFGAGAAFATDVIVIAVSLSIGILGSRIIPPVENHLKPSRIAAAALPPPVTRSTTLGRRAQRGATLPEPHPQSHMAGLSADMITGCASHSATLPPVVADGANMVNPRPGVGETPARDATIKRLGLHQHSYLTLDIPQRRNELQL